MTPEDRRMMRYLHGELPEAERHRFRLELEQDVQLANRLRRFEILWQGLEGPPEQALEGQFTEEVLTAARRSRDLRHGPLRWSQAPTWARLGAAASLIVGLTLGSVASARQADGATPEPWADELLFITPGLADDEWFVFDESTWPGGTSEPPEAAPPREGVSR